MHQMNKSIPLYLLTVCLIAFALPSCVDTFKVSIDATKKYLIVEGTITDVSDQRQMVSISETDDQSRFASTQFTSTIVSLDNKATPLENAKVNVVENGEVSYALTESEPGIYLMPLGFFAQVGNTYQLKINTSSGVSYESSVETMNPVAEINNFQVKYNEVGIKTPRLYNIQIPTHDFYLDFDDPANEQNFYAWTWTDYEIQKICATCKQGLFTLNDETATSDGTCIQNTNLNGNTVFDYTCNGFCWEIFENTDLNIFSDNFTNGQSQKNKLVAQVPVFQKNSSLVAIQQKSLTPGAFRYLKLIRDQSVNNGSLADTPPAPIKSNVVNVASKDELVLGYFTASAVKELRYMLSRSDVTNVLPDRLFSILNNRDSVPEPDGVYRQLVPLAPCKLLQNRTPNAPRNWQFGQ